MKGRASNEEFAFVSSQVFFWWQNLFVVGGGGMHYMSAVLFQKAASL